MPLCICFLKKRRLYGKQTGRKNLLAAKAIHLIVLAPAGYYTYKAKGRDATRMICNGLRTA